MTLTLSAAALRMPYAASVAARAPLAPWAPAAPRAAKAASGRGLEMGGSIGIDRDDRFGGITRSIAGGDHGQDQAQLAGGGPLRG